MLGGPTELHIFLLIYFNQFVILKPFLWFCDFVSRLFDRLREDLSDYYRSFQRTLVWSYWSSFNTFLMFLPSIITNFDCKCPSYDFIYVVATQHNPLWRPPGANPSLRLITWLPQTVDRNWDVMSIQTQFFMS